MAKNEKKNLKKFLFGIGLIAILIFVWWFSSNTAFIDGYDAGWNDSSDFYFEEIENLMSENRLSFLENCISYICVYSDEEQSYCEGTDQINKRLLEGFYNSQQQYNLDLQRRYSAVYTCTAILSGEFPESNVIGNFTDSMTPDELESYSNLPKI